jgi:hypothetical protein
LSSEEDGGAADFEMEMGTLIHREGRESLRLVVEDFDEVDKDGLRK